MAQINLGHVKGDKGDTGSQGPQGIQGIQGVQGPAGPGCPTGGTTGQVLMKDSGTDYDYTWSNINLSTLRKIPLTLTVADWVLSSDVYKATVNSTYITTTSVDTVILDDSAVSYQKAYISAEKKSGGGGIVFTTSVIPTGTITGEIRAQDSDDGRIPVLMEGTVTPIENGGTGQATLSGAQSVLGITALNNQMTNLVKISKQTFSNVEIGSDGNISFSFSGHSVIAIVHDKSYYTCAPWKDAYNYWHGKLTSASNDTHPSSGTVSGTIYYVE